MLSILRDSSQGLCCLACNTVLVERCLHAVFTIFGTQKKVTIKMRNEWDAPLVFYLRRMDKNDA